jgi:RNA-binding protein
MPLTGHQRKHLRGLAHPLAPVVHVGNAGVTPSVVAAIEVALGAHELIKVRMHDPEDKHSMAADMAARCNAESCGVLGHTVILYRPHPEKPQIELPRKVAR